MRAYAVTLLTSTFAPIALASNAAVVTGNPAGAGYEATLPTDKSTIQGSAKVLSAPDGMGALVQVSMSGFPSAGGPFAYHIHEYHVTGNSECATTGGHLGPYNATESPPCDRKNKATCQVGDLAGKHGNLSISEPTFNYIDLYLSTSDDNTAFVGNRSLVVHDSNNTPLTCANFISIEAPVDNSTSTTTVPAATGSETLTGSTSTMTVTGMSSTMTESSSTSTSSHKSGSTGGAASKVALGSLGCGMGVFGLAAFLL